MYPVTGEIEDHPLSVLQDKNDSANGVFPVTEETEEQIKFLTMELKVMDIFLGLQSFTNECSMLNDVIRNVRDIFQDAAHRFRYYYLFFMVPDVLEKIWRTKLKMRAKYSTSLPLSSYEGNIAATPEFIKKFVDTVARSLSDLFKIYAPCSSLFVPRHRRQIGEVIKELKFLRNFVDFISDTCTDPHIQHTFFTHVFVVAVRAVMAVWLNLPDHDNGKRSFASIKMDVSFSDLQILMQPIQPCIRKICVDFLQALKSEQSVKIEYVADCEAGFVETLIHHLQELPIISMNKEVLDLKDQKAILQEMLIILRANLIDQPVKDLMFLLQDIDAIIDAGLLVSLLYDSMEEKEDMDVVELNQTPVLDLRGNIKSIQAVIYPIFRKFFQSELPKIDELGSLDIILDNLKEFLSRYSDSLASIKSQLCTIQQQLEQIQKQFDGFPYFAMQVVAKAYEVEHVVVSFIHKDIPEWYLLPWIWDIIEEITLLMGEVAEIHEKQVADLVLYNTGSGAHTSQFARITSMKEEMVGFDEVVEKLRRQLIRGTSRLDVISIVGMPGLGKTTLANKLFLDQLVVSHFDVRVAFCVSQVYTCKDLLLTILRGIMKEIVISDKIPENELADKLRKVLLAKRYLILVDDVWETRAWDDLKPCFYDANNGSRVILTTRLDDVASHAKLVSDPHFLRLFTPEESWMLLEKKVFNGESCPLVLKDVGQKIAQKCGGLPLSVVLIAGILETMRKEKQCWEQVALDLGPYIKDKSEFIIELSYKDLPYHLKPCFLYFGVFLEDEAIHVSKLTWLWTTEGLVKDHAEKISEDIAEHYLENLIRRNLVMVSKKSSDVKAKACRIHDLLLDFCRNQAKVENFLEWTKGYDGVDPSPNFHLKHNIPWRLSLYSEGDNLAEWSSICSNMRSFHFRESRNILLSSIDRASYTLNSFRFLRVLDMEFTVIDSFPELLTCLRYIAVRIAEDSSLSLLANFWCLETLIVKGIGGRVSLPATIWKMVKLRHLHIYNHAIFYLDKVQEFPNPSKLDDLQTLSSAWFSCVDDADNILAMTPNLRKLRCEVSKFDGLFPAFNKLTKLEMLKFSSGRTWAWASKLNFPSSLKKLTLLDGRLSSLDQVATLPRLEVLKLIGVTINSEEWKVRDDHFPQLKFLKLQSPSFSEWNVSDEAFPILEHLVLRKCRHLKEIPFRFEDASSLKTVEIISCNEALAKSAMAVRETLIDNSGTSGYDIFIHK